MPNDVELMERSLSWEAYQDARERVLRNLGERPQTNGRERMDFETFVAAWNAGDRDAVAGHFTPDGVRHQFALPEARLAGRDAIAQGVGAILDAVSGPRLEVRSVSEGTDGRVTVEWTFSGTHTGDFPGTPASGATLAVAGISVYELAPDGRIARENVYWDAATLMAAAGVLG
jgi:steroid delta-isomerase-like uncharacterized protein